MARENFPPNIAALASEAQKDFDQRKNAISREEREPNTKYIGNLLKGIQGHAAVLRGRIIANANNSSYPSKAATNLSNRLNEFAIDPTYAKYKHIKDELDKLDHGEFAGFERFPEHRGWAQVIFSLVSLALFLTLSSVVIVGSLGLASILPATIAAAGYECFAMIGGIFLTIELIMSPFILAGIGTDSEKAAYNGCDKMVDVLNWMRRINPEKPEDKEASSPEQPLLASSTVSPKDAFFQFIRAEAKNIPRDDRIELPNSMQTCKSFLRH